MPTKTKMINVRATEESYQAVQNIAKFEGKSVSDFVMDAIIEKIEDFEDLMAIREYEKEVAAGTMKYYTLEEVNARLGLTDEEL